MTVQHPVDPSAPTPAETASVPKSHIPDDKDLLRTAAELTRDINNARPEIYWPDMIASALVGYAALAGAIMLTNVWAALACAALAVLALYRALLFIHEISHLHRSALPGFRTAWNLMVGVPMLTPSLMYEGVHTLHHARTRYGTGEDPEYLPLALMKPWSLPAFLLVALLAPVGLLIRWSILTPLGLIIPPLRKISWERFSSLSINPDFRRPQAKAENRARYAWQEAGACLWSYVLISSIFWLGWKPFVIAMGVTSLVAIFNQLRTLVAHLWENDGEAMTVTAQYLDSVNVPSTIAGIWAPVGLRYHALHHLLPSLPYHSLHTAHHRLMQSMGAGSTFDGANHKSMAQLVAKIARSTMIKRS